MRRICLHTTFLNKDSSFDIVQKSIKFSTEILKGSIEGRVSHFFDVGLCFVFMLCRRKFNIIFTIFYSSRDKKITKA